MRLTNAYSTSAFKFSPADDAESFIWVVVWIAETIASIMMRSTSEYPAANDLDGLYGYKSKIYRSEKSVAGPLVWVVKTMIDGVRGDAGRIPELALTLSMVCKHIEDIFHSCLTENPFA